MARENGAAKVYDDSVIVELGGGKESVRPKRAKPSSFSMQEEKEEPEAPKRNQLICCCMMKDKTDGSDLKAAGSTADYENYDEKTNPLAKPKGCGKQMEHFLNSPVYLIFVLAVTFIAIIVILVELFIDTGLFKVTSSTAEQSSRSLEETQNLSSALHWFSFALLSLFFIEILLRVAVWRSRLAGDVVSILDCTVVVIAFLSNLCVTLAVGPESPIDAISLIICIRLIRVHTLYTVRFTRKRFQYNYELRENGFQKQDEVNRLKRQIEEKDFEIKQLRSYLSSHSIQDPQFTEVLKKNLNDQDTKGATADSDLELALALSKQTFQEESNDGYVIKNKAFAQKKEEDYFEEDLAVLVVHDSPDKMNGQESEIETVAKAASYMDDYFNGKSDYELNEISPSKRSTGAVPKRKNMTLPIGVNASNPLQDYESTLKVLQTNTSVPDEPIEVIIDPSILQCETPVYNLTNTKRWPMDSPITETTEEPRFAMSSPPSDMGSSDDCTLLDTSLPSETKLAKTNTSSFKLLSKKSGSSVSSESGYLSEEGNLRKKLAIPAASGDIPNSEINTSAL